MALLKEASKSLEEKKAEAEAKIREILLSVPNLPADIVPEGATAEDKRLRQDWWRDARTRCYRRAPLGAGEGL